MIVILEGSEAAVAETVINKESDGLLQFVDTIESQDDVAIKEQDWDEELNDMPFNVALKDFQTNYKDESNKAWTTKGMLQIARQRHIDASKVSSHFVWCAAVLD